MTDAFAARQPQAGRVTSEVAALLVELARLVKGRAFYAPGSRDLLGLFERAYRCWSVDLERHGPLEIQIDRHSIRAPGLDTPLANAQLGHLRDALGARQVVQLRFEPQLENEAFAALVELLAREPGRIARDGGFARALYRSAPVGIRVNDLDPEQILREEIAVPSAESPTPAVPEESQERGAEAKRAERQAPPAPTISGSAVPAVEKAPVPIEQPRLPMFAPPTPAAPVADEPAPDLSPSENDTEPDPSVGANDTEPDPSVGANDTEPDPSVGANDTELDLGASENDTEPDLGAGQEDTAPDLGSGTPPDPTPTDPRDEDTAPHVAPPLAGEPGDAAPAPPRDEPLHVDDDAGDGSPGGFRDADTLPDFELPRGGKGRVDLDPAQEDHLDLDPGEDDRLGLDVAEDDRLGLDPADDLLAPPTLSGAAAGLDLEAPPPNPDFDALAEHDASPETAGQVTLPDREIGPHGTLPDPETAAQTLPDPDPFGGDDPAEGAEPSGAGDESDDPDPFGAADEGGAAPPSDEALAEPDPFGAPGAARQDDATDEAPAVDDAERLAALLQELEDSDDDALYLETAQRAASVAEKLVETGREEPAMEALLFFADHAGDDAKRAEAQRSQASLQLERLASGTLLGCLVDRACPGSGLGDTRATQVLTRLGAKVASELVRAAEVEPQAERREQLQTLLVSMGEAVLPEVLAAMDAGQPDRARSAVRLARELAHPGAVARLSQLLSSSDASLRQEAAKALARIADDRAIDALGIALSSDLDDLPTVAAFSLGACGSVRAVEPLLHCLRESMQEGRMELARESIRALGRLGCAEAAPALAELLLRRGLLARRRLRELKLAACSALGHLPGDEAVGALAQASHSRDEQLRRAAQTALERREHARRNG